MADDPQATFENEILNFNATCGARREQFKMLADRIRKNRPGNSRSTVLTALETAEFLIDGYRRRYGR